MPTPQTPLYPSAFHSPNFLPSVFREIFFHSDSTLMAHRQAVMRVINHRIREFLRVSIRKKSRAIDRFAMNTETDERKLKLSKRNFNDISIIDSTRLLNRIIELLSAVFGCIEYSLSSVCMHRISN